MEKSRPHFPNFKQAIKAIDRLSSLDWPAFNDQTNITDFIKEFEEQYFKDLEALPNVIKFTNPSGFPLPIFRVREYDSINNRGLISEYSYPPAHLTKIGRCNFPKRPVFYCSNNPMVALMETIRDGDYQGKTFCISRWAIIPSDEEFVYEHFLKSDLPSDNPFKILIDSQKSQIRELFSDFWNDDLEKGFELIQEFLHNAFINDESYGLSATLAHRTLFARHNLATDILIYPSVQTKYKGINMAISPNFVQQQMLVQRFYVVKVDNINSDKYEFGLTFVKYAVMDKSRIMWRNTGPDDIEFKDHFFNDFKRYISDDFDLSLYYD